MSDIPPELIPDILCPLPVKSLLRFRCVCKSWKSLINSPNFIKAHLKRQQLVKPNSDFKLILQGDSLLAVDFSSICSTSPIQPQELDHPLKLPIQVVGSCNGLLFMSYNSYDCGLWNPTTKMFRELPDCHIESPEGTCFAQFCAGFGYDSSSDDYKVVRTAHWFLFDDSPLISQTWIYSLNLDLWNKVQGCPYLLRDKPTCVGDALQWIAGRTTQSLSIDLLVLGFDLGSERFQEVPCPENLGKPYRLNLAVLGECLCLLSGQVNVHSNAKNSVLDRVDIWVMKNYGVKESWIKLSSVEQLDGRQHFSSLRPIAYSMTGGEVLLEMDHRKLLWYNLDNKSLKPIRISGISDSFESFVSLGTLVPLNGGGNKKDRKKNVESGIEDGAENIEEGDDSVRGKFKVEL